MNAERPREFPVPSRIPARREMTREFRVTMAKSAPGLITARMVMVATAISSSMMSVLLYLK